jgi:protein-disulfide isomerase
LTELTSAPLPPLSADDHVRGPEDAVAVIVYGDFECPYCAALSARLAVLPIRHAFRHFPVRSSHRRAWPAACAAEAAGIQGRFWEMYDLLFADQGRLEDPHLWRRAEQLELDLDRFESDRRSAAVEARVREDFQSGVRAGVVTTPTVFANGRLYAGRFDPGMLERAPDAERGSD